MKESQKVHGAKHTAWTSEDKTATTLEFQQPLRHFRRAMEKILENMPGTVCFLDDVLVAGATEEEALRRLDQALKRLRSWKLVLKQTKCKFLMSSVQYLGVEVSAAGVPNC